MSIPPRDPSRPLKLLEESEDLSSGGAAPQGSARVREHLGFEVQDGEHGDSGEFAKFGGQGAASKDRAVGEGEGPLGQFGVPGPNLFEEDGAELSVNFFEGAVRRQGLGFVEMPAIQEVCHAFAGGEGEREAKVGAAEEDGFAEPGCRGARGQEGFSKVCELVQAAGSQGADPAEKVELHWGAGVGVVGVSGVRRKGRRAVHLGSIALALASALLLFGCKRGTPLPRDAGPAKARLLGVSYGGDPLRLPDGRTVSRERFRAEVVAWRAKSWLFLKAFLAAKAREGKVASLDPVLRERYRKVLGASPGSGEFLPKPAGKWGSWSALDDLVSAALLFREKEEEADFGGAEAVRRAFHRMRKAYNRGHPRLVYEGDSLFGDWDGARAPAGLCYPDVLALLTPIERDQVLLDLAGRIKTRQAPGAGR